MVKKKKLKDEFKEFRNTDKSAYKTFKIPLKSILQNKKFSRWKTIQLIGISILSLKIVIGEMMKILKQPEVQSRFQGEGGDVTPITPEQFAAFINTEIAKWDKAVRASGAKID